MVLTEFPCVVLWRPEALDCRVLIPPEAWSWLTRNPPSVLLVVMLWCATMFVSACCIGLDIQQRGVQWEGGAVDGGNIM